MFLWAEDEFVQFFLMECVNAALEESPNMWLGMIGKTSEKMQRKRSLC